LQPRTSFSAAGKSRPSRRTSCSTRAYLSLSTEARLSFPESCSSPAVKQSSTMRRLTFSDSAMCLAKLAEDVRGEHQRAQGIEAEELHGLHGTGNLAAQPEERGIDQLQHLCGHRHVFGNQARDAGDRGLVAFQFACDLEVERGEAGQRLQA